MRPPKKLGPIGGLFDASNSVNEYVFDDPFCSTRYRASLF
jgi:hypothetical protein